MRRKSHAPFWSSGRRSDPPIDCNRLNLSIRQHVAAVGRRVTTLCKGEDGLHQQLALYHVYHNFCLPHTALRQPLPQPELTKGTGSAKQWQLQTPAMAAALTDHVWTLREVLLFRVPPWPLCFARKVCRFARRFAVWPQKDKKWHMERLLGALHRPCQKVHIIPYLLHHATCHLPKTSLCHKGLWQSTRGVGRSASKRYDETKLTHDS